jgi:hypothetical protein
MNVQLCRAGCYIGQASGTALSAFGAEPRKALFSERAPFLRQGVAMLPPVAGLAESVGCDWGIAGRRNSVCIHDVPVDR